jgi:hypothetical protein
MNTDTRPYRILDDGERIRVDDEFHSGCQWHKSTAIGLLVDEDDNMVYRRFYGANPPLDLD